MLFRTLKLAPPGKFHQTVTILIMAVFLAFPAMAAEITYPAAPLKIGANDFTVEVATTREQQEHGLMFRTSLADDRGMLFIFPEPNMISMWMKNTLIPLDMLFLGSDGRIIRIAENTKPESLDVIPSPYPAKAVLELAGGTAKKKNIHEGDFVVHEAFTRTR